MGLYWVPGHAGVRNKITDELARGGSALKFVGPRPTLEVSRQDKWFKRWLVKQHWVWWRGLGNTQRQARDLVWVPRLRLSFNGTQSRAVTGLPTGHNTLRRHLPRMGLSDSPLCRCGAEDETSAHIFRECEALASLTHVYLGSFLEPQGIKSVSLGAISKVTGLP